MTPAGDVTMPVEGGTEARRATNSPTREGLDGPDGSEGAQRLVSLESHVWHGDWLPEYEHMAAVAQEVLDGYSSYNGRVAAQEWHGSRTVAAFLVEGWRPPETKTP